MCLIAMLTRTILIPGVARYRSQRRTKRVFFGHSYGLDKIELNAQSFKPHTKYCSNLGVVCVFWLR